MAKTYRPGHVTRTASLPPKADLRARMSGIGSRTSGFPPGPDVGDARAERRKLTRLGHRALCAEVWIEPKLDVVLQCREFS